MLRGPADVKTVILTSTITTAVDRWPTDSSLVKCKSDTKSTLTTSRLHSQRNETLRLCQNSQITFKIKNKSPLFVSPLYFIFFIVYLYETWQSCAALIHITRYAQFDRLFTSFPQFYKFRVAKVPIAALHGSIFPQIE